MIIIINYVHILSKANCGIPLVERNDIELAYNSTLEGSLLIFWCEDSPNDTLIAQCLRGGRWSVDLEIYDCNKLHFGKCNNITSLHEC